MFEKVYNHKGKMSCMQWPTPPCYISKKGGHKATSVSAMLHLYCVNVYAGFMPNTTVDKLGYKYVGLSKLVNYTTVNLHEVLHLLYLVWDNTNQMLWQFKLLKLQTFWPKQIWGQYTFP